jgi:predicted transcriptional regulator
VVPVSEPAFNGDALVDYDIKNLTADIVSAHIANNNVSVEQLPALIRDVHQALATIGQAPAEPIKAEPAVDVKKSVFPDHIICLECGQSLKMLKRHLASDHDMTPEEYRAKWGLPPTYPMVAPEYAATRSQLAKDSGLGRRVEAPPPPPPNKPAKKSGAGRKVEAPPPEPTKRGRPKRG